MLWFRSKKFEEMQIGQLESEMPESIENLRGLSTFKLQPLKVARYSRKQTIGHCIECSQF